ncbi:Phosphoglucomutase [Hibiscus syriacus]|uniref:Phosphoglucomutase n=1 Tax=Hibiscus syriacus TaxID=106335 RepID=A0A6A2WQD2_HIBSY|nr:Phosphoglucomutase [Hibiscus syriacus]
MASCCNSLRLEGTSFSVSHPRSFSIEVSSSSTTIAEPEGIKITSVPTKPIEGQKTGTSGLRKKIKVFMEENSLSNWIQSFNSLPPENYKNGVLVLGGDGRYFNREASQFNYNCGQPAPESITDKIYGNTLSISEIKMAEIPDVDISHTGVTNYGNFTVEVIDPVLDYLELLESVLDFQVIKSFLTRSNFRFAFDAMHAVTGTYAKPIFVDKVGDHLDSISNGVPLEDFGHDHPDPNLTYAKDLVNTMYSGDGPDFGAASDDVYFIIYSHYRAYSKLVEQKNMILGRKFIVTPSDSVAIIAANAQETTYFQGGPKGFVRSMPTSGALDRAAKKLGLTFFERLFPKGKFFKLLAFYGNGSSFMMLLDGRAVLAWLSIIAYRNKDKKPGEKLVSVSDVVKQHWATYGRNFFSRYDYEECASEGANKMIEYLRDLASKSKAGEKYGNYALQFADDFSYTDPTSISTLQVDGSVASKQSVRFVFTDGSRIIFRSSVHAHTLFTHSGMTDSIYIQGTGSAGATVRVYIEQFEPDASKHDMDATSGIETIDRYAHKHYVVYVKYLKK